MKVKLLLLPAFSAIIILSATFSTSVSGKWKGTLKTPDDIEYPLVYNLKADNGKLIGTGLSPQGEFEISDGKINGDDFTFGLLVDGKTAKHTGKYIAVGDSVSLDIDFDGYHFHSTLLRAK